MLIVRRRTGESIRIGDAIEIQILEAGPNRVKLGVVAPAAVPVVRSEVLLVREENLAAGNTAPAAWSALLSSFRSPK
jgi:carbon storage regulator